MKKLNILILIFFVAVFAPISVHAESVKGYVYDNKTKEPIIGALVTIQGQNIGAQTDFDGRFLINDISSDTKKLLIRSMGYKEHSITINLTEDSVIQDLGIIYLKSARSKHYNRFMVSFNPVNIPMFSDSGAGGLYLNYSTLENDISKGISGTYLYGYNFYKDLAIELGAKYNYTFHSYKTDVIHTQSKHHSVAVFTNLVYNKPIRSVTMSPYLGLYMRKFLYSKLSYGDNQGCVLYDMERHFNNKWFNPGVQLGIGIKYKSFYIGAELNYDFDENRSYDLNNYYSESRKETYVEYSISLGFEF